MLKSNSETVHSCKNCSERFSGNYCPFCGQKEELSYSIRVYLVEAIPNFWGRDGRFGRTLKMLFFNPGRLTRRFHAGMRTRYLSPISMLLSAVFVLFTLPLLTGMLPANVELEKQQKQQRIETISHLDADILRQTNEIAHAIDDDRISKLEELKTTIFARNSIARLENLPAISEASHANLLEELSEAELDWIDRRFHEITRQWSENPELKISNLQTALIKYSWLLVPLSLPLMIVVLPGGYGNRFKHALFGGYSLAFFLILVALLMIMSAIGVGILYLIGVASVIIPIHLFVQTKNAYRLSFFATVFYFFAIALCIVFGLTSFAALLFALNLL